MAVLHYKKQGNGPCMVFLHGYMDSSRAWDGVVDALSESYTCIAIDLPGHGGTPAIAVPVGFVPLAKCINEILEENNIGHCHLVGHSMGGYAALAFAQCFPGKVNKLVLVHSHPFADMPEKTKRRQREKQMVLAGKLPLIVQYQLTERFLRQPVDERWLSELDAVCSDTSPEGACWALDAMAGREDFSAWLKSSQIPFLVCLSPLDAFLSFQSIVSWVDGCSNGIYAVFAESRHFCFWEEAVLFRKTISAFINNA